MSQMSVITRRDHSASPSVSSIELVRESGRATCCEAAISKSASISLIARLVVIGGDGGGRPLNFQLTGR